MTSIKSIQLERLDAIQKCLKASPSILLKYNLINEEYDEKIKEFKDSKKPKCEKCNCEKN